MKLDRQRHLLEGNIAHFESPNRGDPVCRRPAGLDRHSLHRRRQRRVRYPDLV